MVLPKWTVKAARDKVGFVTVAEVRPEFCLGLHVQISQTCSGIHSVQDPDCLRELLVDNRSKDCVFKCVSYLHTLAQFMYFYNFTVKICLKMYVFYIKYLLYKVERYETFVLTFYIEIIVLLSRCNSLSQTATAFNCFIM